MNQYKHIHIWEFPSNLTYIKLDDEFRKKLFKKAITQMKSQQNLVDHINKKSKFYGVQRKHSRRNLYSWINGEKIDRNKKKTVNIPLWVLIVISKSLADNKSNNNIIMKEIEFNIIFYTSWGRANPVFPKKLPFKLTPELISVIFHFVGDGHIGRKKVCSSYRQMNKIGLDNFLRKLQNVFGTFTYSKLEYENGKIIIPKIITHFYSYYFKLGDTTTFKARIPPKIIKLGKKYLLAGLLAFIVDEGHIGCSTTIYSKNLKLLEDIQKIAKKCEYKVYPIRKKYAYNQFDAYRFNISAKSREVMYNDMMQLAKEFPTCTLAQKTEKFKGKIRPIFSVKKDI